MRDHPVNSTSTSTPVDPISAPSKIHCQPQYRRFRWLCPEQCSSLNSVSMVELPGTAPGSRMCPRCFNVYHIIIIESPEKCNFFSPPGLFFSKYGIFTILFTMMDLLHNVTYLFATFACVVASSGSLTRPYCANGPLGPAIPSATKKRT